MALNVVTTKLNTFYLIWATFPSGLTLLKVAVCIYMFYKRCREEAQLFEPNHIKKIKKSSFKNIAGKDFAERIVSGFPLSVQCRGFFSE